VLASQNQIGLARNFIDKLLLRQPLTFLRMLLPESRSHLSSGVDVRHKILVTRRE
jgi:hypothetical protein